MAVAESGSEGEVLGDSGDGEDVIALVYAPAARAKVHLLANMLPICGRSVPGALFGDSAADLKMLYESGRAVCDECFAGEPNDVQSSILLALGHLLGAR